MMSTEQNTSMFYEELIYIPRPYSHASLQCCVRVRCSADIFLMNVDIGNKSFSCKLICATKEGRHPNYEFYSWWFRTV